MSVAAASALHVTVACAPGPRQVLEIALELPPGSCVRDALAAADLARACPELDLDACTVAVGGRKAGPEQPLREHDRVEVLRPLVVDPKVARRERFSRQGARTAGLFAKPRPGAKPGY